MCAHDHDNPSDRELATYLRDCLTGLWFRSSFGLRSVGSKYYAPHQELHTDLGLYVHMYIMYI